MAGAYAFGLQSFGNADIDWLADDIKVVAIDANFYTVNLATHQYLSDIPIGARVVTSSNLTGKTNVGGVLDADDVLFDATSGHVDAFVGIKDTGVAGTSILIFYEDCGGALPLDPVTQQIRARWDNNPDRKIMKL